MGLTRRQWLKSGAAGALGAGLASSVEAGQGRGQNRQGSTRRSPLFDKLQPLGDRAKPITIEEMKERLAHAQQLMRDSNPKFDALYIAPGTSMYYFFGVRWGLSERLFAFVLPRTGDPFLVCPAFEEGRAREVLRWEIPVRVWQEDENPNALAVRTLAERGIRSGRIGVEEHTRFTFFDGLRKAGSGFEFPSADPVTIGCRGRKTAHEVELMQLACEATVDVYRAVFDSLTEGMTQGDVGNLVRQGFQRMGLSGGGLVLFGEWAALPHGTRQPQQLKEGDVVLVDGGTSVEDYRSDVTRTAVLGRPSEKQRNAFSTVRRAQEATLAAAVRGKTTGSVDDAARKVITDAGYGPGYKLFTHRVGHGIGLDGHEHPYLVRGSKTILESGMTFSNEPGIYVRGEYGVRLEDVMVIEPNGPARLLTPALSTSLERPFG